MSNVENRRFWVSADIGPFCTPKMIREVYGEYVGGVEAMGWFWCSWFLELCKKEDMKVRRIHGRIGNPLGKRGIEDSLKVHAINSAMVNSRHLIELARRFGIRDILVHTSEADSQFNNLRNFEGGTVWVENDISFTSGLGAAFDVAKALARTGQKAGVTGDVGHFGLTFGILADPNQTMGHFITDFSRNGGLIANEVEKDIHLPINYAWDNGSINLGDVRDQTLKSLFALGHVITIENQVGPLQAMQPRFMKSHIESTKIQLARLCGFGRNNPDF